jgi:hypothetical protein
MIFDRQRVLLEFLDAPNEQVGPTSFQMLLFLFTRECADTGQHCRGEHLKPTNLTAVTLATIDNSAMPVSNNQASYSSVRVVGVSA